VVEGYFFLSVLLIIQLNQPNQPFTNNSLLYLSLYSVMINPVLAKKAFFSFILIYAPIVFTAYAPAGQPGGDIVLHDERLPVTPKEFYIANVVDERENRGAIAWLLPPGIAGKTKPELIPVDLRGGGFAAMKQFIEYSFTQDRALRPVIIRLKKCEVTESAPGGGQVEGHIVLAMSFNIAGENGADAEVPLTDYNGSTVYRRTAGLAQDIEPALRHMLESSLLYLNTWMNRQANINIKLAKKVKIDFADYTEKPEGDTIYYSAKRPLTWDDFQSKIGSDRYDAQVFPTFGYDERLEVANAVAYVRLLVKVSLPKSACWVRDGSRNDYTLNHEQRHFDIARIAAGHFKQKINANNLTVTNFEGIINSEYLEAYREMSKLQKEYDNDTRHGADASAQQRWNERLSTELATAGGK